MYLLLTIYLTMLNETKGSKNVIKLCLQEYFCKLKKRNIL